MSHYENEYKALLVDLISKAEFCQIEPPVDIIEIIKKYTQPNFSFDHTLFQELHTIGLPLFHAYEPPSRFTEQEKHKITMLIAWLISGLQNWTKSHDLDYSELKTFLVILHSFNISGCLYELLPSSIREKTALLDELQHLISRFQNISIEHENMRIWENETVIKFETAILNRDWLTFSKLWCFFENTSWSPNFLMTEMILLLATLDFKRLCNAFCNTQGIVIFMLPMYALTDKQILVLGVESDNPFVEFVAFYHAVSTRFNKDKNKFNKEDESQVVTILNKVSKDTIRFQAWMDIFNKYPVRYPLLQTALGLFLADADSESMDVYINTISLNRKNDANRVLVTQCLETFNQQATFEKRKMLWTKAFNRWSEWNFETNESCLIEIAFSELDFALVGYFIECLSEQERSEYKENIFKQMIDISIPWYPSITDFNTRWYQLISQFQPVTHALNIENKTWLMDKSYYIPNKLGKSSYLDMLFGEM